MTISTNLADYKPDGTNSIVKNDTNGLDVVTLIEGGGSPEANPTPLTGARRNSQTGAIESIGELNTRLAQLASRDANLQRQFSAFITGQGGTLRTGSGAPVSTVGVSGDLYYRIDTQQLYGPKKAPPDPQTNPPTDPWIWAAAGQTPASPISLKGDVGTPGTPGVAGPVVTAFENNLGLKTSFDSTTGLTVELCKRDGVSASSTDKLHLVMRAIEPANGAQRLHEITAPVTGRLAPTHTLGVNWSKTTLHVWVVDQVKLVNGVATGLGSDPVDKLVLGFSIDRNILINSIPIAESLLIAPKVATPLSRDRNTIYIVPITGLPPTAIITVTLSLSEEEPNPYVAQGTILEATIGADANRVSVQVADSTVSLPTLCDILVASINSASEPVSQLVTASISQFSPSEVKILLTGKNLGVGDNTVAVKVISTSPLGASCDQTLMNRIDPLPVKYLGRVRAPITNSQWSGASDLLGLGDNQIGLVPDMVGWFRRMPRSGMGGMELIGGNHISPVENDYPYGEAQHRLWVIKGFTCMVKTLNTASLASVTLSIKINDKYYPLGTFTSSDSIPDNAPTYTQVGYHIDAVNLNRSNPGIQWQPLAAPIVVGPSGLEPKFKFSWENGPSSALIVEWLDFYGEAYFSPL